MLTRADESDLIEDIKDGVGIALSMRGASAEAIDSIKLNKLAYLAITELDVPITFGWYKYGPAPVDLQYSETAVSAQTEEEYTAPDQSRLPQRDYYSPREYAYFFDQELDGFQQILQTPTKEFLVSFYDREAPPTYRELYKKSAQLQQLLDEIQEDSSWHENAETYYREVSQRAGELTRELMDIESLREARKPFRLYVRFLKKLLAQSSAVDTLSAQQQRFVRRVIDYYYSNAWKYVALMISEETVHLSSGDNEDALLTSIENDKQEIRSSYEDDIQTFEERAVALGIGPQQSSEAQEADRVQTDTDREQAELWATANAEAISEHRSESESDEIERDA